ncbi:MAG: hypothetical protein KDH88_20775 [Chromatiales bacterium]|nr:hypothetical protein [Chromatiales bacterium]
MKIYKLACMALAVTAITGCSLGDGDDDDDTGLTAEQRSLMADVSKAYVPSLFYTNNEAAPQPIVDASKSALGIFDGIWEDFAGQSEDRFPAAGWSANYATIRGHVSAANGVLNGVTAVPANLIDAHENLESIRTVMAQMRRGNDVDDIMDDITDAHRAMGEVVAAFSGASSPATLTAQHKADLASRLPTYRSAFDKVAARQIESELFGFSDDKTQSITAILTQNSQNITALENALSADDDAAILAAANMVRPLFVRLFLSYGDFLTPSAALFAAADKAYVPALFSTNNPAAQMPQVQAARNYLTTYETAWRKLSSDTSPSRYPSTLLSALGWTAYFSAIDENIEAAKAGLDGVLADGVYPANTVEYHEHLEEIRLQLLELRTFESYPWVMDPITRYHRAFEPALGAVSDVTSGDQLSDEAIGVIAETLVVLQEEMPKMVAAVAALDGDLYGFSAEKLATINDLLDVQPPNLDALDSAIENGDKDTILNRTRMIKSLFVPFFLEFGEF